MLDALSSSRPVWKIHRQFERVAFAQRCGQRKVERVAAGVIGAVSAWVYPGELTLFSLLTRAPVRIGQSVRCGFDCFPPENRKFRKGIQENP